MVNGLGLWDFIGILSGVFHTRKFVYQRCMPPNIMLLCSGTARKSNIDTKNGCFGKCIFFSHMASFWVSIPWISGRFYHFFWTPWMFSWSSEVQPRGIKLGIAGAPFSGFIDFATAWDMVGHWGRYQIKVKSHQNFHFKALWDLIHSRFSWWIFRKHGGTKCKCTPKWFVFLVAIDDP